MYSVMWRAVAGLMALTGVMPAFAETPVIGWHIEIPHPKIGCGDDPAFSVARFILADGLGGATTVGQVADESCSTEGDSVEIALVSKIDANGQIAWQTSVGGYNDNTISLAATGDAAGNTFVAGNTFHTPDWTTSYAFLAKVNSLGQLLWMRTISDAGALSAVIDGTGNVFIGGSALLAKYNPDGVLRWKKQVNVSRLAVDSIGYPIIIEQEAGTNRYWLARYRADGALLWRKPLPRSSGRYDQPELLTIGANGGILISGITEYSRAATDAWTAKYNSAGALLWKRQFGNSGEDWPLDLVESDTAGNVLVAGTTAHPWVVRYGPTGSVLWKKRLPSEDGAIFADFDAAGNIVFSGGADSRIWVDKYDASGLPSWSFTTASNTKPGYVAYTSSHAVDKEGSVFVSGTQDFGTVRDFPWAMKVEVLP